MVLRRQVVNLLSLAVVVTALEKMDKVILSESDYGSSGGRCLDGTMAGYYYGKPPSGNSDLVVINLAGGGACYTKASCAKWAKKDNGKAGGSAKWTDTLHTPVPGIVSDNPSVNPDFYGAHHVHVPYCSADGHGGQVTTASSKTFGLYFSGHLNFQHIVDHVVKTVPAIAHATRILLTGNSAGGIGTFVNCDYLQDLMTTKYKSSAKVSCAPTAGWFVPGFTEDQSDPDLPPSDYAHWSKGQTGRTPQDTAELWQQYLPPACTRQKVGKETLCSSATVAYPYVKAPMYVMENQYDTEQLQSSGLPRTKSSSGDGYIGYFGRAMRNSTALVYNHPLGKKGDGLFLPSCALHGDGIGVWSWPRHQRYGPTKLKGYTCADGLGDWFFGRGKVPSVLVDDCVMAPPGLPCNPKCGALPTPGPSPPSPPSPPPGPSPPSPSPPGPSPPSPPPGPSPSPGGCKDEMMKDCGAKMSSQRECANCARDHAVQIALAGCTHKDITAICKGLETTVVV